ncbi:R-spondin-2-like isoform X1 [Ptychodera flava]|uniref:R-spondin-2-like isoform X1 n=1 Tax=Ptychodera flava TaxID=63121 RepID=UPI00396A16FA
METFRTVLILLVIWFCEITPSGCRYRSTGTSRAQVTTGVSPLLFDQECRHGCKTCSTYNGCVTCRPRLFLLLHRSDMKHIGICTHECPVGYYGHRAPEMNMCYKCKVDNCAKCFGRTFCTRCQSPYYLSEGDCVETCPDDMYPDEKTSECKRTVDCEVSTWSAWGICLKMDKACGFKRGLETRTREVIVKPSSQGRSCPTIRESKPCKMKPRHCPDHLNSSEPKPAEERGKNNKKRTRKGAIETKGDGKRTSPDGEKGFGKSENGDVKITGGPRKSEKRCKSRH